MSPFIKIPEEVVRQKLYNIIIPENKIGMEPGMMGKMPQEDAHDWLKMLISRGVSPLIERSSKMMMPFIMRKVIEDKMNPPQQVL